VSVLAARFTAAMSVSSHVCAALALLGLVAAGCQEAAAIAEEVPSEVPRIPLAAGDSLASARALLVRVEAGRDLLAVDDTVGTLATDGRAEALGVAGALLGARWRRTRSEGDLRRALDLLHATAVRVPGGAVGCEARARRAALLEASQSPEADAARQEHRDRCVAPPAPRPSPAARTGNAVGNAVGGRYRRIVLDPGHGGTDPGAVGPTGLRESTVTLDVARRVADRLATRYGMQVLLTRDSDTYVDLEARAMQANLSGADLFVSLHCNAAHNTEARGLSTFVLEHTSDRVAARVLRREGELIDSEAPNPGDVTRILADLRLSQHGRDSLALAHEVQRAMLHDARLLFTGIDDMGVHPARFHVLVTARMPAVLVELSFLSNPAEEARLRTDAYRDVLASAVARAVAEHR
jgi:N-acetylmuramoyl-L-alanine amidase